MREEIPIRIVGVTVEKWQSMINQFGHYSVEEIRMKKLWE